MSTITKEFTKEQLIAKAREQIAFCRNTKITGEGRVHVNQCSALFEIALASLEAEPVAYIRDGFRADGVHFCGGIITAEEHERTKPALSDRYNWKHQPLYTAPPAPVSVPDFGALTKCIVQRLVDYGAADDDAIASAEEFVYNACRSAMLQGAEPVTTANKLPMQPLVIDAHGTLRFKENPIVRALLDYATEHGYGLNEIAMEELDAEDQMQLAQLIGYSLSGYGTLSFVTDESYERAAAAAQQQEV